ncbi:MAG: hypothetical protein ACREGJ_01275 [Candidatus Saccharimonadales bacterium]
MGIPVDLPLTFMAEAMGASNAMRAYVTPTVTTLCVLASLACAFFLVNGGIQYMTSAGNPEKLQHAKQIIKNALIGLILVIAAGTLTAILSHAYTVSGTSGTEHFPTLQTIEPADDGFNFFDVVIKAVVSVLRNIVQTAGEPFVNALGYFTNSTPLMGGNASVFNLWLAVVGITDVLFILVIVLIGFQVMSAASLGFDEVDLKQLLPQMAFIFLLINTSIFAIDAIIGLSNAMIYALQSGFPSTSVWDVLADITKKSSDMGIAGLLVMISFLILSVMLLVYYMLRLVGLYIGAILAPVVLLLWLLPTFKDFAITALKTYLVAIFVLFVHVVILLLAASIFVGILAGDTNGQPNTLMALILGLATVLALLKAQGMMNQLISAASAPKAARELSSSFMRGVSYMTRTARTTKNFGKSTYKASKKLNQYVQKKQAAKAAGVRVVTKPSTAKLASTIKPLKTGETLPATKVEKVDKR